jgi:cytochrome P450
MGRRAANTSILIALFDQQLGWEMPLDKLDRIIFAYFPFWGGSRLCIGNQLAFAEAQLILATILSQYQFRLLPGTKVVPEPLITLRPRGGLFMIVHRQEG